METRELLGTCLLRRVRKFEFLVHLVPRLLCFLFTKTTKKYYLLPPRKYETDRKRKQWDSLLRPLFWEKVSPCIWETFSIFFAKQFSVFDICWICAHTCLLLQGLSCSLFCFDFSLLPVFLSLYFILFILCLFTHLFWNVLFCSVIVLVL